MELKDSGAFIRMAYQAMQELDIDADLVLSRCGLDVEKIADKELRTPHAAQKMFWNTIQDVSQDPDIGLHLGEKVAPYRGQVIEYLFLSSSTFGEGLHRALNYQRLLSDAIQGHVGEDERGHFVYNEFIGAPLRHLNEAVVGGLITFFKFVTEGAFQPTLICFNHDECAPAEEYRRIYGCEVLTGQQDARVYFDAKILELPSSHAEPELLRLHEKAASEYVARLEKQDLVGRVNRVIAELLESGNANLETVAAKLEMKPRLLRTRLSEAGTNFNQVLADYRCNLAKRLLSRTDESIDEIVYLTGFSEPSTFYRAFKRWVGLTPIEYRKHKANRD